MVDFSKAFNRIDHNVVITILIEMNVPGWLLKIVIGFLTEREMFLRYRGITSDKKRLPQGTLLGLFIFLIMINAAGFPNLKKHLGDQITQKLCKRTPLANNHLKYIDDMAPKEAIHLKKTLISNPELNPPRPLA